MALTNMGLLHKKKSEGLKNACQQTREKFLAAFKSFGYKKGTALDILANVLKENVSFAANTQKLFK